MYNLPSWIIDGVCKKDEKTICNLGYACDGCPYNAFPEKINIKVMGESIIKPKQDKDEISPFAMGELDKINLILEEIHLYRKIESYKVKYLLDWVKRAIKYHEEEKNRLYKIIEKLSKKDVGGWKGCDSKSINMCMARKCKYVEFLYLIDEGNPEVNCNRPAGEKWDA